MEDKIISKIYRIISIIILSLCAYFLLLPFISPLMEKLFPSVWVCPFLRITGHGCPFCGITRGVGSLYSFDIKSAGVLSMVAFMAVLIEAAYRIMVIMFISSLKRKIIENMMVIDVIYHLMLVIATTVYVIMYLVTNF